MILIFRSETTKAIYSWNGKEVVTIVGSVDRPVGKIMRGLDNKHLEQVFKKIYTPPRHNYDYFKVGDADYQVLQRIDE